MKRRLLAYVIPSLFIISVVMASIGPARADDALDLKKLQPLSTKEQANYEKAKDDPANLHAFIVTRTYLRTVAPLFRDKKDVEAVARTCPKVPDGISYGYTESFEEMLIINKILTVQQPKS